MRIETDLRSTLQSLELCQIEDALRELKMPYVLEFWRHHYNAPLIKFRDLVDPLKRILPDLVGEVSQQLSPNYPPRPLASRKPAANGETLGEHYIWPSSDYRDLWHIARDGKYIGDFWEAASFPSVTFASHAGQYRRPDIYEIHGTQTERREALLARLVAPLKPMSFCVGPLLAQCIPDETGWDCSVSHHYIGHLMHLSTGGHTLIHVALEQQHRIDAHIRLEAQPAYLPGKRTPDDYPHMYIIAGRSPERRIMRLVELIVSALPKPKGRP